MQVKRKLNSSGKAVEWDETLMSWPRLKDNFGLVPPWVKGPLILCSLFAFEFSHFAVWAIRLGDTNTFIISTKVWSFRIPTYLIVITDTFVEALINIFAGYPISFIPSHTLTLCTPRNIHTYSHWWTQVNVTTWIQIWQNRISSWLSKIDSVCMAFILLNISCNI